MPPLPRRVYHLRQAYGESGEALPPSRYALRRTGRLKAEDPAYIKTAVIDSRSIDEIVRLLDGL